MAATPIAHPTELEIAVERARLAAQAAGELDLPKGPFESPLPADVRALVSAWAEDGSLAEAIAAVAAEDPELA